MPKVKWRKSSKPKSAHLHIRAEQDQLRRWHRAAERDRRSLTSWVSTQLDRVAEK